MLRTAILIGSTVIACGVGCAYPRGATPLSPAAPSLAGRTADAPPGLFQLEFVSAEVPATMRSGLAWDGESGSRPEEALADPYLEIAVNGQVLWQSPTLRNVASADFHAAPDHNLVLDRNAPLALALWDDDTVGRDPIGVYTGRVFATTMLGEEVTVTLEGGAKVTLALGPPKPLAGTGIAQYELHSDAVWVLSVIPASPAGRAGLAAGDRIRAMDGVTVRALGLRKAESKLALAADQHVKMSVQRGGQMRQLELTPGPVWLSARP